MQTFLPLPSFAASAAVLDDRRLGKQRVETMQILRALHFEDYGWRHHPVVLMWRGYTRALVAYGLAVVAEWEARGWGDATRPFIEEFARPDRPRSEDELPAHDLPTWLGWEDLHVSHQSALVRKDPGHYRRFFPVVRADLPYVWPEPLPPHPEPPTFTAWAFRPPTDDDRLRWVREEIVEIPPAFAVPGATPKQRRQVVTLRTHVRADDLVVVADPAVLLVGAITEPPVRSAGPLRPADTDLVRHVRWLGELRRARLQRPYQLQNPRALFPLYDEPALQAFASGQGELAEERASGGSG